MGFRASGLGCRWGVGFQGLGLGVIWVFWASLGYVYENVYIYVFPKPSGEPYLDPSIGKIMAEHPLKETKRDNYSTDFRFQVRPKL